MRRLPYLIMLATPKSEPISAPSLQFQRADGRGATARPARGEAEGVEEWCRDGF